MTQSAQNLKTFHSGILDRVSSALVLLSAAVFYFLVPLLQNEHFFFRDDYQTQYLPAFYEIGRILNSGEFPFISTRTLLGGNFAGEYQYAVFNPVSLISYFFLYRIIQSGMEFHQAAVFIPFINTLIIIFFINASLNLFKAERALKFFSVSVFLGSGTLVHWFYGNYIPGLVSLAWLSFFLYTVLLFYKGSKLSLLLPVSVYMTVSSGWPLQVVVMGLVLGLFFLFLLVWKRRPSDAFRFFILAAVGLLFSAPALVPFLEYGKTAARSDWAVSAKQWKVNPIYFLQLSNPFFGGKFMWWDGQVRQIHSPMLYVSIFFLPLIYVYVKLNYKYKLLFLKIRQNRRDILLFLSAVFLLLMMLSFFPNTNALRYMFRLLPPAVLIFSVWTGIFLSGKKSVLKELYAAAAIFCGIYFLQTAVQGKMKESLILSGLTLISILIFKKMNRQRQTFLLPCISAAVFALSSSFFASPDVFIRNSEIRKKDNIISYPGYSLFVRDSYTDFRNSYLGNAALLYGIKSVNGYSPIMERKIFEYMCMDYFSRTFCSDYPFLAAADSASGKTAADLLDLNFIQVLGKFELLESYLIRARWKMETVEGGEKRYTRVRDALLPEGISNIPQGIILDGLNVAENAISFNYKTSVEYSGGPFVLSRFFWKGHRAYINSSEVSLIRVLDFFPGIVLPPAPEYRRVNIVYRPPGFGFSLLTAFAGLLIYFAIIIYSVRMKFRRL